MNGQGSVRTIFTGAVAKLSRFLARAFMQLPSDHLVRFHGVRLLCICPPGICSPVYRPAGEQVSAVPLRDVVHGPFDGWSEHRIAGHDGGRGLNPGNLVVYVSRQGTLPQQFQTRRRLIGKDSRGRGDSRPCRADCVHGGLCLAWHQCSVCGMSAGIVLCRARRSGGRPDLCYHLCACSHADRGGNCSSIRVRYAS